MSKVDKKLVESLIALNNQIIAIKPIIKTAKVLEIRKLIRKIKQLGQKKGTSAQLEKNKRKCDHLKLEIQLIKKLKYHDVVFFTFENEGQNFNSYVKTKKLSKIEDVAVSRVGLNKKVIEAVEKIKSDPKIDGWKRTFIAYKFRCEKRRSWKEKIKLLKELDSKFTENENEIEIEIATHNVDEDEVKMDQEIDMKPKVTKQKSIKAESNIKVVQESKPESESEQDEIISQNELEPELGSESEYESGSDMGSVRWSESESEPEFKRPPKLAPEPTLKPLIITNKPPQMEIRQINLDECENLDELPIDTKSNEIQNDNEQIAKNKLKNDAFFLDADGNEIESRFKFDPGLRRNDDENGPNRFGFRSQREFRQNSSFKSSLSGDNRHRRDTTGNMNRRSQDNLKPGRPPRQDKFYQPPNKNPTEDVSKLHPSWAAKKIAEQKLASLKFEGKKIKFDD